MIDKRFTITYYLKLFTQMIFSKLLFYQKGSSNLKGLVPAMSSYKDKPKLQSGIQHLTYLQLFAVIQFPAKQYTVTARCQFLIHVQIWHNWLLHSVNMFLNNSHTRLSTFECKKWFYFRTVNKDGHKTFYMEEQLTPTV